MKVPVHKSIITERIPESYKAVYHTYWVMLLLVLVIGHGVHIALSISEHAGIVGWTLPLLFLIPFDALLVYFVFFASPFPKELGTLEFQEKHIRFVSGGSFPCSIQYTAVAEIYIGRCPSYFTMLETQHKYFSEEAWAEYYGNQYIIALDEKRRALFACTYDDAVWNFLKEKYRNTAVIFYNASDYAAYDQKQKQAEQQNREIEAQVWQENGGAEFEQAYHGYIN